MYMLEDALVEHLKPVTDRWTLLLADTDLGDQARVSVQRLIRELRLPKTRTEAARTLVLAGYSGRVPAEFWSSVLGQVMFGYGGYPYTVVPTDDARHILGVSRQAIGQLRMRGSLAGGVSHGMIGSYTYESVQERWKRTVNNHA